MEHQQHQRIEKDVGGDDMMSLGGPVVLKERTGVAVACAVMIVYREMML
jgi:hypothetical protein